MTAAPETKLDTSQLFLLLGLCLILSTGWQHHHQNDAPVSQKLRAAYSHCWCKPNMFCCCSSTLKHIYWWHKRWLLLWRSHRKCMCLSVSSALNEKCTYTKRRRSFSAVCHTCLSCLQISRAWSLPDNYEQERPFFFFLLLGKHPHTEASFSKMSSCQQSREVSFYLRSVGPDFLFPARRCLGLRSNTCRSASPFLPWRFISFWEFFIIFFAFFAIWEPNKRRHRHEFPSD